MAERHSSSFWAHAISEDDPVFNPFSDYDSDGGKG